MNWNKKSLLVFLAVLILLAAPVAAGCGGSGGGAGNAAPDPNGPSETVRKFLEVPGGDCAAAMANFSMSPALSASVLADCQQNVQRDFQLENFEVEEEQIAGDTAEVRYRASSKMGSTKSDVTGGFGLTRVNGVWKITSYLPPAQP